MNTDGPKRAGRFLKKGTKVLEKVNLVDFSFQEINKAATIAHDNYRRSIVHSQYHELEELDRAVVESDKFDQDLMSPDRVRPIILPLDFTQDWERDKLLRKDRVSRSEDEEYDYEVETQRRRAAELDKKAADAQAAAAAKSGAAPLSAAPPVAGKAASSPLTIVAEEHAVSVDQLGQAIKSMKPQTMEPSTQPPIIAATAPRPVKAAPAAPAPAAVAAMSTGSGEFIPVSHGGEGGGSGPKATQAAADGGKIAVHEPEQEALKAYQQRLAEQKQREEDWAKQAEASKAEGYRDGFRAGEEKADLQVRQTAGQMFGKIAELMAEFSNLKHLILDNVQENFYEICQAMAESLLKREFSIRPDAFVSVLRRAIDEAVEPGKFQIHVHPDFYEKISAMAPADAQDLRASLVKDAQIVPGDFKIESSLSVVDVSIKKMIEGLLAQADLQLFGGAAADEDKAS